MCPGAGCYFSPSKPHSGTLCTIFIFIRTIFILKCNILQDTGRRRWRRAGSSPYWSPSQRESCSSSARSLIAVYRGITKELHCFTYKESFIFYCADHHPLHRPGAGAHQADRPEPPAVRGHLVLAALRRAARYICPLRGHQLLKGGSRYKQSSWNESSPILKFHNHVEGPDQGLLLRPSPYDLCICDQWIKSGKALRRGLLWPLGKQTFVYTSAQTCMWQLLVSGSRPVVSNILSWQFLKLLLMIISKFCIQSYFLSIIVRQVLLLSKFPKSSMRNNFVCGGP